MECAGKKVNQYELAGLIISFQGCDALISRSIQLKEFGVVASRRNFVHTLCMLTWWEDLRRLWRRPKVTPQPPSHLGGREIPKILGVCEDCGAVVVEGLHQLTPAGFLCQRCVNSSRNKIA